MLACTGKAVVAFVRRRSILRSAASDLACTLDADRTIDAALATDAAAACTAESVCAVKPACTGAPMAEAAGRATVTAPGAHSGDTSGLETAEIVGGSKTWTGAGEEAVEALTRGEAEGVAS